MTDAPKIRLSLATLPTLVDRLNAAFGKLYEFLNQQQTEIVAAQAEAHAATQAVGAPGTTAAASGALPPASFLTAQREPTLSFSRRLVAGVGITVTDNGAGNTVVVAAAPGPAKAQRITTGSIAAASFAVVTLTWSAAFADALYTPVATVVDSAGFLTAIDITSFTASVVTVRVQNNDSGAAHTGTLCVHGIHD